ncbi:MAG TPA: MEDS domain-containing protein [Nitrososphaera sp.]|nr:MEDS domain-containing protein [Nitrososphaera sp.]
MTKHHSIYFSKRTGNEWYRQLHRRAVEYLKDGYTVLYAVETNPEHVMESLASLDSESGNFAKNNRLVIVDRSSLYPKRDIRRYPGKPCDLIHAIFRTLRRGRRGRCVIFGMPISFTLEHLEDGLTEYESLLGSAFDDTVELICCYNRTMFRHLSLRHLVKILNTHQYTVHRREWNPSPWPQHRIVDFVTDGLDESLGPGSGALVLKTLKSVYRIDEHMVVASPEIYEEKLRKLIGSSADRVIGTTAARMTDKMVFEGTDAGTLTHRTVQ